MNCYTFVTHDSGLREIALIGSGNGVFVEDRSNSEQDIVEFVEDLFKKSSFKSLTVASSCLGVTAKTFSKS